MSTAATKLMGRMMAATSIIAGWQKGEERVVLTMNSRGLAGTITTEAIRTGEIRGYTTNPKFEITDVTPLGFAVAGGTFTVRKILYNHARPHDSIVPIAIGDVSSDVIQYYQLSEQIPAYAEFETHINYRGEVAFSGGLIIEALPPKIIGESNKEYVKPYIERLKNLPPVSVLFGEDMKSLRQVLDKIAPGEIDATDVERIPVDFYCRCSKSSFMKNLKTLGPDGLKEFFRLAGSEKFLTCQYCATDYFLTDEDMNRLHEEMISQRTEKLQVTMDEPQNQPH